MKKKLLLLPFFLGCRLMILSCQAQLQVPAKIEHYSTEDGLSHDIITTMFKDHEGFMWFGTWCGLNRFDGSHFSSFKSVAGDSLQIKNNRIDHITEDNHNNLWLKAYDGQIYQFDKVHERFRSLAAILRLPVKVPFEQVLSTENDELWISVINGGIIYVPNIRKSPASYFWYKRNAPARYRVPANKINCFLRDAGGDVWLGTDNGLVYLKHNKNGNYNRADIRLKDKGKLSFTKVVESADQLFFATKEGRLFSFKKHTKEFENYQVSNEAINNLLVSKDQNRLYVTSAAGELIIMDIRVRTWQKYIAPDKQPLHSIFEDKRGNIWIEPDQKGVFRLDKTGVFKNYTQSNDSKNINPGNHFKVFEDNNGVVWCVLRDGGFGYYDVLNDKLSYFHNEPGAKDHAFSNLVTVAFYDVSGVMWLHTDEHGLEKVIFQPHAFEQRLVKESAVFQSDNEIRALCVDQSNRGWICAKGGQVYWLSHGVLSPAKFSNANEFKLGAVYTIIEDHNGNIWMGTKANGLFEAIPDNRSRTSYRLINFLTDIKNPRSISSNQIYAIREDKNGRIWVGTFDHGLNLLQTEKQQVSFLRITKERYNYPDGFEKIRVIETDLNGRLWLGTTEGLLVVNQLGTKYTFETYNKRAGDKESLGNNDIQFIHRDHSGHMWLATSGGGLALANAGTSSNLRFTTYTTKQGLANDYILSCTEDDANHLWIATKSSLSRLDLLTKKIKNFSSYDGLSTAGFSEGTCQNTKDGKLLFGTIHGYLTFDPHAIIPHPISANLVFTNFQINNEQVGIADSSGILSQSINYTRSITLRYNQNVLSVDYSLLDYRFGSHLPFMYRLKGFDKEWQDNINQLRTTYTNIPAGNYLLEIKCADPDRYRNLPYKSLAITVLSAPWLSWWAYLIYAAVIITIAVIIWRNKMTAFKLKQKMEVEHRLTELKLNFFTNISHELRTPLTLILNPIAQLARFNYFGSRERQYIDIVDRNANRMVRFVNQLLEFRKLQYGKATISPSWFEMKSFIKDIAAHFDDIRREKDIDLIFQCTEQSLHLWLDQDKIETVIYNLLSNAYKFTPEGKVITIRLEKNPAQNEVIITLTDQGCGVPEADLERIFELYHTDQSQPVKHNKGTGIGLALSKDFVELLGGTISATNVVSGGLSVKVILPYADLSETTLPPEYSETIITRGPEKTGLDMLKDLDISAPLLLLVEDNKDMREFLRLQLSEIYRVETASDGVEGLEKAQVLIPDIVLSDVMMPRMDGIAFIDKLKSDPMTSHIPVVLMSARSAVEHQIVGLKYGADFYLSKPFSNELLLVAIGNILEQRRKLFEKLTADKRVVNLAPGEIIVTSKDETFLKNVVNIIGEKMADPDFDIETVAESVNMGRATFYKKFKSLTQVAPVEFVRDMRLQRAKQYFDAGLNNVAEVGYTVGFSSPKYFSTCYKAKYHIAPSDYLKSIKAPSEIEDV